MHLQPEYLAEYLAQVNRALRPSSDYTALPDFLYPLRMYLTKRTAVISFALARYCGASPELALVVEWLYQTSQLNYDKSALLEENTLFLRDKYARELTANPNLQALLLADIENRYLPLQLKYLRDTTRDLVHAQTTTHSWLTRYLGPSYLHRALDTKYRLQTAFYTRRMSPDAFASELRYGEGFALLVVPCLVGFLTTATLRPQTYPGSLDCHGLESALYGISTLYELTTHTALAQYYYAAKLPAASLTGWYVSSPDYRRAKVQEDWNTQKYLEQLRARYRASTLQTIRTLALDPAGKQLLQDLVHWSE